MSSAITLIEAVQQALAYSMRHDPLVVVLGEDVGRNGGVFRATLGLYEEFGAQRVLDTPLDEAMIAGLATGMSLQGLKPVAEFQFMGFSYPALDQIINHTARYRNRTRGRLHCPLVFRMPYGAGVHAPEHHSESMEALFAHAPGLRVVVPSSPLNAYGLLLAAIDNPDPVIFLEPTRAYRSQKQIVPNTGVALPLDQCFVPREGHDVTLVGWGAMMKECLESAEWAHQSGIEVEVIDVATLKPLDMQTILNSVEKTGRLVIVHEAPRSCGVGAEIAASVAESGLFFLQAPIQRVTGYDTIVPYFKLEKNYMPNVQRIMSRIHSVMRAE